MARIRCLSNKRSKLLIKEKIDPRVKRTKKLLLDAHNELIEEIGISNLSIQKITDRATLNRATFYAHFNNLEDLTRYAVSQTFLGSIDKDLLDRAPITEKRFCQLGIATYKYMQLFSTDEDCSSGKSDVASHSKSPRSDDLRLRVEKQIEQELYAILLNWLTATTVKANSRIIEPKLQALAMGAALCTLASQKDSDLPELSIKIGMMQLWSLFQC